VSPKALEKAFEAVEKPIFFLLFRARKALYSSMYASGAWHVPKEYVEEYRFKGEEVIYPVIYVSKKKKEFKLDAWFLDVNMRHMLNVFYNRLSIGFMVWPDYKTLDEITRNPPFRLLQTYVFPPVTLESYLFFYLNRRVQEILMDYMEKHGKELPEKFAEKLNTYKMISDGVGMNDRLPDLGVVEDPIPVRSDIVYMSAGTVKQLRYSTRYGMNYFAFYDNPLKTLFKQTPEYSIILEKESYEFRTKASGLKFLAGLNSTINESMRKVLTKLEMIGKTAESGALILTALYRFYQI